MKKQKKAVFAKERGAYFHGKKDEQKKNDRK
jgi:hypothetical protein